MDGKTGSKNKPKKDQPTLFQMNTRSKDAAARAVTSDIESDEEDPITSLKSTFQKGLQRLEKDLSRMHDDLRSLEINFEKAFEFLTKRVEDLESREKLNSDRIKALEDEVQKMKQVDLEQADRINVQERFSRRSNIRIVGFPCTENESCEGIVKSVMEKVGVSNVRIERAHRDGRLNPTRPRHILAKLSFYQDKITALKHQRRALENEPFFITDDLTKRDLQEKRKWASQVTQLYNQGTKLRFSAGKWRNSSGKPFEFTSQTSA